MLFPNSNWTFAETNINENVTSCTKIHRTILFQFSWGHKILICCWSLPWLSIPSIKILKHWSGNVRDKCRRLLIHFLWFPKRSLCLYFRARQRLIFSWDRQVRWNLSRSEQISHTEWLLCFENLTHGSNLFFILGPKSFLIIAQKVEKAICSASMGVSCWYILNTVVTFRKLGKTIKMLSGAFWPNISQNAYHKGRHQAFIVLRVFPSVWKTMRYD